MKNVRHKNIIQLLNIYGALKVIFLAKKIFCNKRNHP